MGNIVNRVFDSSGPEGKVRGTPQQIIDKYSQLARDAQLSNDRVAAENFQQHAEHYTRMLGEAMREAEARREQQEAQNRDRQQQNANNNNNGNNAAGGNRDGHGQGNDQGGRTDTPQADPAGSPQPDVIDTGSDADSGLVDTPESRPQRQRRPRKPKQDAQGEQKPSGDGGGEAPAAAE